MSPKKITDTDKLELIQLYRQTGETTASLANRYGVSNSTISRILKTTIPEPEYEELIQQKRGAKNGSDEEVSAKIERAIPTDATPSDINTALNEPMQGKLVSSAQLALEPIVPGDNYPNDGNLDLVAVSVNDDVAPSVPTPVTENTSPINNEDLGQNNRRVRRRSSAPEGELPQPTVVSDAIPAAVNDFDRSTQTLAVANFSASITEPPVAESIDPAIPTQTPIPSPTQRTPILRNARTKTNEYFTDSADLDSTSSIETDNSDEEEDDNPEDVNILAAMFGEEIADGDDEDFDDDDDDDEFSSSDGKSDRELLTIDRLHLQIIPLSQAILPRTCYIVIDKFAELIVRPLKDFAELGQIPGEEIQQRTLPIFDNHRVAKRFSNQRTQRVIKVPDSKVFHKTSQHLRSKGITRLLVDGNIYSLN
jgi:CENP-B N-terminal DNA-binding domain